MRRQTRRQHNAEEKIRIVLQAIAHHQHDDQALSVPELHGFILGYALSGYPDHPQTVIVPFKVSP